MIDKSQLRSIPTAVPTPPAMPKLLENYQQIRQQYLQLSTPGTGVVSAPISDPKGFYRAIDQNDMALLGQRVAGFDKLFYSLVNNIVDDPDFALRKDPDVYRRMLRDPHIHYCLQVRKSACTALPWMISPPHAYSKDPQALALASAAERRLKRIPKFSSLLSSIMDALLPGLSVNELLWKYDSIANGYTIYQHYPVNKDRFKFDKNGNLRLLQPTSPTTGVAVPNYKFVTHTYGTVDGSWNRPEDAGYVFYGRGLADTPLYHYFYFKVTTLRFLLKSLERHAGPLKIFYTGPQNDMLASRMASIMAALQNDSVVCIPGKKGDTDVQIPSAGGASSQQAQLYMQFLEYIDRLITRVFLGQDLMTEMPAGGSGSYALGAVHKSVFEQLTSSDKDQLQHTINNTIMRFDAQLNTPGVPEELWPQFSFRQGIVADAGSFLHTCSVAQGLGLTISEVQVREATGLREPLEGEGILGGNNIDPTTGQPVGGQVPSPPVIDENQFQVQEKESAKTTKPTSNKVPKDIAAKAKEKRDAAA